MQKLKKKMFCGRIFLGQGTFPLLATFPSTHTKKEVSHHSTSDRLLLAMAVFSPGDVMQVFVPGSLVDLTGSLGMPSTEGCFVRSHFWDSPKYQMHRFFFPWEHNGTSIFILAGNERESFQMFRFSDVFSLEGIIWKMKTRMGVIEVSEVTEGLRRVTTDLANIWRLELWSMPWSFESANSLYLLAA